MTTQAHSDDSSTTVAPAGGSTASGDSGRRPLRILVTDDSAAIRSMVSEVLIDQGYEVTTASSGARALRLMTGNPPDVLVTDLFMPGMNGFELRALMLGRPELAAVRVIVVSAYWHRPSETLDVSAVLTKPLNIDRLLETVRMLDGRPPANSGEELKRAKAEGGGQS